MSKIVRLMARGNNILASGITEDQVIGDFCTEHGLTENDILNNTLEYVEMTSRPYRKDGRLYTRLFEKVEYSCTVREYLEKWR